MEQSAGRPDGVYEMISFDGLLYIENEVITTSRTGRGQPCAPDRRSQCPRSVEPVSAPVPAVFAGTLPGEDLVEGGAEKDGVGLPRDLPNNDALSVDEKGFGEPNTPKEMAAREPGSSTYS